MPAQDEPEEQPKHDHDKPCKQPINPELGQGIELPVAATSLADSSTAAVTIIELTTILAEPAAEQPRHPRPPPIAQRLYEVRTTRFLI